MATFNLQSGLIEIPHPHSSVTSFYITPSSPGTYCFACTTHYGTMHFTYVLDGGPTYALSANAQGATSYGDPHLNFAEGGQADFRGRNDTWYALFSAPGLQFAAKTIDTDFLLPRGGERKRPLLVHGSFFVEGAWTIFAKGRLLGVSVDARNVGFTVFDGNKGDRRGLREGLDGLAGLRRRGRPQAEHALRQRGRVADQRHAEAARLDCRRVQVAAGFGRRPAPSRGRKFRFPHGLLGQSFDFDGAARDGKMDTYDTNTNEYTTLAMAEGAIEGTRGSTALPQVPHEFPRTRASGRASTTNRSWLCAGRQHEGRQRRVGGAFDRSAGQVIGTTPVLFLDLKIGSGVIFFFF